MLCRLPGVPGVPGCFDDCVRCCTAAPASSHAEQGLVPALDWLGEKLA